MDRVEILYRHIIYISGLVLLILIRVPFSKKYSKNAKKGEKTPIEALFLILLLIGFQIIPIIYLGTDFFHFADYVSPDWTVYVSIPFVITGIYVFFRSHFDLRENWSPLVFTDEKQRLITTGIYKYFRHPMYGSHIYWFIAQGLLLPNYVAGLSGAVLMIPFLVYRIPREEKAMLNHFGEEYKRYMDSTYSLIPFI